jgi:hypothetical protein
LSQAETIGPACLQLINQLFAHRVLDYLRAAQGVMLSAAAQGCSCRHR